MKNLLSIEGKVALVTGGSRGIGEMIAAGFTLVVSALLAPSVGLAVEDPELQARVDDLKRAVEASPTTPENVQERARVLWEWTNTVSLEQGFVPLNATVVVRGLLEPPFGADPAGRGQLRQIDDYVRRLALIDDPGTLGTTGIDGPEAARVDSLQTYRVTYTLGRLGIESGGRVLIARQFASALTMQTADPSGEGWVSVAATRSGTRFEPTEAPIAGAHGGFRGAVPLPAFRISGEALREGDVVTVTYGDVSRGGAGMRVGPFSNDAVLLPLYIDHGDGLFHEVPSPTFRVVGGPVAGVHGFAPSIVGTGESVTVSVRAEDAAYSRATGQIPAWQVSLNGGTFRDIEAATSHVGDNYAGAITLLRTTFDEPGVYRFTFRSSDGSISGKANPILVESEPSTRLYWGETHGHSGYAEGLGTPDGYFSFGRDDARLDFITLSEHDIWMDDREWKVINDAVAKWSKDGEYIVFPGYEWTARRGFGGHHNVFYRGAGFDRVPTQEAPVLSALYRGLHARYDPADVLVIPHAHQAGDWRLSDLSVERLVELVSGHGTFEWFGRYYLESGHRVGFIGASDDHIGHPGYAPGRGGPQNRSNIFQFGSLAAVLAPEKTHDAIFDGLRARSAYAATGADRIILLASLNDQPMGTEMAEVADRLLKLRAIGTSPIESITVVHNGEEVHEESFLASGADDPRSGRYQLAFESDSQPFIRDNPRGHRSWRGTISVDGAVLESVEITGKRNPHSDYARLEGDGGAFSLATRGLRRTVDLVLRDITGSSRVRVRIEPTKEAGRAPVIVRPNADIAGADLEFDIGLLSGSGTEAGEALRELPVGRYEDTVRLRRLPDELRDDVTFEWRDTDPGPGGDWYYLRVRQIDGATAWTSPWWIGGEASR